MDAFTRDLKNMDKNGSTILMERKAELNELYKAIKAERNGFRIKCLAQDIAKREAEYKQLDALV